MAWQQIAREQGGAVTRAQLRAAGCSDAVVDGLLAAGRLVPVQRGVFRAAAVPGSTDLDLWVAVLATQGLLGYETALWLWGCRAEAGTPIHVVVPHRRRVTIPPGVRLHRQPVPLAEQQRQRGLPVCGRAWALADVIGAHGHRLGVTTADRALQQHWLTLDDLDHRLRRWPGRTGNPTLRRVLATVSDGAAAESERILHGLLRDARLEGWRPNLRVVVGGTFLGVADIAFPALRLAIEVDGLAWHRQNDRFEADRVRQNRFVTHGWTVLRFTWKRLTDDPAGVIAEIAYQVAIGEALPRVRG